MSCIRTGGTYLANNLVEVVTVVLAPSDALEVRDDAGCLLRLFYGSSVTIDTCMSSNQWQILRQSMPDSG